MTRRAPTTDFQFDGFESPNTTPVPDVVFDRLLAHLGEAELKALLYIIRRTFGFKKDRDPISFNQFLRGITTLDGRTLDAGCGVRDRTTLSKALKSLEAKGIVISEKGTDERGENVTTVYRLRFRTGVAAPHEDSPPGVVGNSYHRGRENPPPVVGNAYPQQTELQQTAFDSSNIRKRPIEKIDDELVRRSPAREARTDDTPVRHREVRPPAASRSGMATVGETLARKASRATTPVVVPAEPRLPRRVTRPRRVDQQDEAYQVIQAYIADFSRELNDRAPLRSSTTRAYNLYRRSGLELNAFVAQLYAARAIVKERAAVIRSHGGENAAGFPVKHRAGYYFAVLEDLLGLRERPEEPQADPDAR
ncbi:MAG: hypothetical protein IT336_16370 [Thermomicrobiales bacterium]|nr:hypothetical protein [Thermomicrobiales bacterium]